MSRSVLIDGMNLSIQKGTGVSTYARNLSTEIRELGHKVGVLYGERGGTTGDPLRREIEFFDQNRDSRAETLERYVRSALGALLTHRPKEIPQTGRVVTRPFSSRMPTADTLWNSPHIFAAGYARYGAFRRLGAVKMPNPPDITHWTYPIPLYTRSSKNIYTIHDLVPLRLPYTTLDHKRAYLDLLRDLVSNADHIATVSEASRRDIIELLDCPEDKVTNTYQSVEIPDALRNTSEEEVEHVVKSTFNIPYRRYYLFYGSIEPKKNVGRLIEAYLASKADGPLVVVGARAWKSEESLQLLNSTSKNQPMRATSEGKQVIRFEYASFPLLVSLIRGARAVVFPSLYEGFGLPVLEGMTLGTPVISSTQASVPEIAGDAALLVDPYEIRQITAAIDTIDADPELRDKLSKKGVDQAKKFSREAYRDRLRALYENVLSQPL